MLDRPADDVLYQRSEIHLDWLDWFRVLFGRPIHFETRQRLWIKRGHRTNTLVYDQASSITWVDPLWRGPAQGSYAPDVMPDPTKAGDGANGQAVGD